MVWLVAKRPKGFGVGFAAAGYCQVLGISPFFFLAARTDPKQTCPMRDATVALKESLPDYGYEDKASWEDFKESPVTQFIPFVMEHGLASLPDMAAAIVTLPVYVMARTGEIAQEARR